MNAVAPGTIKSRMHSPETSAQLRRTATSSWFDKLTMRAKPLKTRDLILSLSKDEAKISCFFSSLLFPICARRDEQNPAC